MADDYTHVANKVACNSKKQKIFVDTVKSRLKEEMVKKKCKYCSGFTAEAMDVIDFF